VILSRKHNAGIFLNPRTGTTTICSIFEGCDYEINSHEHLNYERLSIANKENYQYFCFYRDPVDRFLSAMGLMLDCDRSTKDKPFPTVSQYIKTLDPVCRMTVFMNQKDWLDFEYIHYVPYSNFEVELKKLAAWFGITLKNIPKYNHQRRLERSDLSRADLNAIEDFHADDYEFFEKAGLLTKVVK
jgi:hypothetical protein